MQWYDASAPGAREPQSSDTPTPGRGGDSIEAERGWGSSA